MKSEQIRLVDKDFFFFKKNIVFLGLTWKTLKIFYVVQTLVNVEDRGVLIYLVKY